MNSEKETQRDNFFFQFHSLDFLFFKNSHYLLSYSISIFRKVRLSSSVPERVSQNDRKSNIWKYKLH